MSKAKKVSVQKNVDKFYDEILPTIKRLTNYDETTGIWTPHVSEIDSEQELKIKLGEFRRCYTDLLDVNYAIAPFRISHTYKRRGKNIKKRVLKSGQKIYLSSVYQASSYCCEKLQMQYITPISIELSEIKSRKWFWWGFGGGFLSSVVGSIVVNICTQCCSHLNCCSQLNFNILITTALLLVLGSGFYFIYSTSRFFHIAHAVTLTFAAYLTYFFSIQLQYPVWLSIPLAIVFATIVGMLSEIALYKPLRRRNASPMVMMIASLGLYIVLQNIISLLWGDDTKSVRTWEVKVGHQFIGAYITDIQIITIAACLTLFIACVFFMKYSRIGRNIRAVASNPELSNIVGISSDHVILQAFAIGSALVAVAGILIAFDTDMRPTMGFSWLLYGVVAMIIGGVGSHWGLIGGALLLATSQHIAAYYIGSQWMDAVAYIILISFLIARPLGFSGKRLKKIEI